MQSTLMPAGTTFARFIKAMAVARGDPMAAEAFATARRWPNIAAVCKAAVAPVDQAGLDYGFLPVTTDFAEYLRPLTLVGRLQGMRRAPFRTRVISATAGGSAAWVDENEAAPASRLSFDDDLTLLPSKVTSITVLTAELMAQSEAGSDVLIARDSTAALVLAMDQAFADPALGATSARPASISFGAASFESSGATLAAIDADLQLLIAALTNADMALTTAAWLMAPGTAATLAGLRGSGGAPAYPLMTAKGGLLFGLPVLTSTAVAASGSPGERFIVLVEASEILLADEGQGAVEIATHASIQMNDAPSSSATTLTSLWQNGLIGVRASRWVSWHRRRAGAVAVLRSVNY